jgi:hypothetical protein
LSDRYEAVLSRLSELSHEITLLQLGLEEVNNRLESVVSLQRMADNEDLVRRKEAGEEDLVG